MKRIAILLLLLLSAFIFGWMLGYLNIPLAIRSTSFWMGFAVALVFITLIILLINFIFSKDKRLLKMPNVLFILVLIALTILLFFGNQSIKNLNESEREAQNLKSQFSRKLDELKNSSAVQQQQLFKVAFERLQKEIKIGNGKLSENAIQSIVSFSASLKPYHLEHIDDSLLLSPERGLLLMGICQLEMDTNSFNTLIRKVDFSYADLRMKEFVNLKIDNIKLNYSNLEHSFLKNVSLENAKLNNVNLNSAELSNLNLQSAYLVNTNLKWAVLKQCILDNADLHDSQANNSQIIESSFKKSNLKRLNFSGSLIEESQFIASDLMSSIFVNTTIFETDFSQSRLNNTSWLNVKISNLNVDQIVVNEKWLDETTVNQVDRISDLQDTYDTYIESQIHFPNDSFLLKKKHSNN